MMPPASFQKVIVFPNPEGLYVYRKPSLGEEYDPSRGRILFDAICFYKYLMPLASVLTKNFKPASLIY